MDLLFSSSPARFIPSTPSTNRIKSYSLSRTNHRPLNSSPLAHDNSSPISSPVAEAQARRQSQYKSRVPSGSQRSRHSLPPSSSSKVAGSSTGGSDSQKAMMRDRFKQRCLERAEKARAKARASKRKSGDIFDDAMEDDVDESDDDIIQSELYQRIVMNQAHQQRHAYLRSYYAEVGSSFDPDLEDVTTWERELQSHANTQPNSPVGQSSVQGVQDTIEMTPEELEQAELEAYAEECERQVALAEFEDIPLDELFDEEELKELMADDGEQSQNVDVDMDL
ncbi:hypothetical protein C8R42DRAFT_706524 [Lentinula raphanica]|nr:hypothetical protein C8R42DRAFT_706524 [Lentinula raphanica]